MPEAIKHQFCLAEVEPGRVALCRMHGDPIEADSWKEARAQVPEGAFAAREGHGIGSGFHPDESGPELVRLHQPEEAQYRAGR